MQDTSHINLVSILVVLLEAGAFLH